MKTISKLQLSQEEREAYEANKQVVREGQAEFVRVGLALMDICDNRQYREDYGSFAEFCAAEYGFSDRRGRQLIAAARVVKEMQAEAEKLGTDCSALPKNESQARQAIAARKPICDTPAKNPPPVLDVDDESPKDYQEQPHITQPTIDDQWKSATGNVKLEPELPAHIVALIDELKLCRDNCDCFIDCVKSQDCEPDSIKDAAKHLKKLAALMMAYAAEISE